MTNVEQDGYAGAKATLSMTCKCTLFNVLAQIKKRVCLIVVVACRVTRFYKDIILEEE